MSDFENRAMDLLTGADGDDQFVLQILGAISLRCKGHDIDMNALVDRLYESAQTKLTYRDAEPAEKADDHYGDSGVA